MRAAQSTNFVLPREFRRDLQQILQVVLDFCVKKLVLDYQNVLLGEVEAANDDKSVIILG